MPVASVICWMPRLLFPGEIRGRAARRQATLETEHRVLQAKEQVLAIARGDVALPGGNLAVALQLEE
jgi:hypothetical protein